jgi:nucleoside-diphosphate-sugar epimerase
MKILITGNMGYVGPLVVQRLRASWPDAFIIGLDMGFFANCLTNAEVFPECRVDQQHFADVRSLPESVLKDVDAIIHLAAISNDPMGNRFEAVTHDINFKASIDLASKAKTAGVKTFIFASSCSMYGSADDRPRTEDSPLNPLTAYAKSKVATEKGLQALADGQFKATSLRFCTACGMSDRLRLDLVLNDFVAGAVASKRISILSDGTPWRPLIDVQDMARAIEWAVQRGLSDDTGFLAVNVGRDEFNYQVKDLAESVARVIPGVDVSINPDAPPDKRSYRVSFERFRKLAPEHQPQVDLISSIKRLKEGLEAMEFQDKDFRNSRYMRLKVLTQLLEKGLVTDRLEWARGI